jgi:hypothetical protein
LEPALVATEGISFISPNSAVSSGVKTVMKPASILVVGLTLLLTGCNETKDQPPGKPQAPQADRAETDRALRNMATVVSELKASPNADKARQHVGDLWIQAGHLKSERRDIRNVEGLLSDLEGNLRSSQQDAGARRHIVNNLEYEIEALKRKNR